MCSEHQPKPHQLLSESNICNLKSAGKEKQPLVQQPQLSTCPFLCCHELPSWTFPKFLSIPPESRMKKKSVVSQPGPLKKGESPKKSMEGAGIEALMPPGHHSLPVVSFIYFQCHHFRIFMVFLRHGNPSSGQAGHSHLHSNLS